MNSRKAKELIDRLGQFQSIRAQWDAIWDFIALRTSPKNACFQSEHQTGQPRSAWHKYDSTASLAINKWASAMDGITTPKTQKWHGLTLTDEKLSEKYHTYLEEIRDTLFARRYAANSNFANANYENLRSVGTFGNGAFSLTESRDFKGNVYKAWNLREFFIDQNYGGEVDTFFRKFRLTARQAKQEFGENCPERIKEAKNLQEEFEFLWAVYPNTDYVKGSLLATKKKYASIYVCITTCEVIEEGGFDICPLFYQRYDIMPSLTDPYGYAPILLCMPEVKDLNKMIADLLTLSDRQTRPIMLSSEDDLLEQRFLNNGVLLHGGLDGNGNERIKEMISHAQTPITLQMIQDMRQVVNEGFNLNLFQILVNKPNMTATEVMQRAQEQGTLLGSFTSRREKEFLSPLIVKEVELAERQGDLPPVPEELQEAIGSGEVFFSVKYESPIVRAQKADEAAAIFRTLETATVLQNFDPTVKNKINAAKTLETVASIWGAPQKIFNTDEEKELKDMNEAQLQQAQQMLNAAPVISKSAKDMAEAQAKGGLGGIL